MLILQTLNETGQAHGKAWYLPLGTFSVGREVDSRILLEGKGISRNHASLVVSALEPGQPTDALNVELQGER